MPILPSLPQMELYRTIYKFIANLRRQLMHLCVCNNYCSSLVGDNFKTANQSKKSILNSKIFSKAGTFHLRKKSLLPSLPVNGNQRAILNKILPKF